MRISMMTIIITKMMIMIMSFMFGNINHLSLVIANEHNIVDLTCGEIFKSGEKYLT